MRVGKMSIGRLGGAVGVAIVWLMASCGGEPAESKRTGGSPPADGTAGASGSQQGSEPESVLNLDNVDAGTITVAAAGQQINITLQTIGPGEYGTPEISSSAVRFVDVSYLRDQNPGGPRQLFRFEAVSAGEATIRIEHTGDLPEVEDVPEFTVTIVVE